LTPADEFHHAAAATYQGLFTHYSPKMLLCLTATPERMNGKSILDYFENRIAAEIRLPDIFTTAWQRITII